MAALPRRPAASPLAGLALAGAFAGLLAGCATPPAVVPIRAERFARPQVPAEARTFPYRGAGALPACGAPEVNARITDRFREREAEYWTSNLTIAAFDESRPVGVRPSGLDLVPRRYCTATALFSDGARRTVDYALAEDQGFAGASFGGITSYARFPTGGGAWGVEWCVVGLDRSLAYAPYCRMARP